MAEMGNLYAQLGGLLEVFFMMADVGNFSIYYNRSNGCYWR
jgi:hypothetical protein